MTGNELAALIPMSALEIKRWDTAQELAAITQKFLDAKPRTLQKRGAARDMAKKEIELYEITLELERADPSWKAAGMAARIVAAAEITYPYHKLDVPVFPVPRNEQAKLIA